MKRKRHRKKPKPKARKQVISYLSIFFFLLSLLLTYVIVLKGLEYDKKVFTWSLIALFLGVLLESWFIFRDIRSILNRFTVSLFCSLFALLPGKSEKVYDLRNHIESWPYIFLICFIIGVIALKPKEVTVKQTEGTTFLQSLALIYWLYDFGVYERTGLFTGLMLVIIMIATLFSVLNAFTTLPLSEGNRLVLSVWSSVVLICFAIDNTIRVFSLGDIDEQIGVLTSVEVAIQYFFVGLASVYVVQNINMLFVFLPEKHIKYRNTFHAAKRMHLNRYSDVQVRVIDTLICIVYCAVFFVSNSIYQYLPRHTMIWFVIITFPFFLYIQKRLWEKSGFLGRGSGSE